MTDAPIEGSTSSEDYNFATLTYTRTVDGAVVETRPLTPEEIVWVTIIAQQQAAATAADTLRRDLIAGLMNLAAAQALAQADIPVAVATAAAATADQTAALALKVQADALAAKPVPVLSDIKALAAGLSLLCQFRADVDGVIIALSGWRKSVDENAILTDQSLTFLGHLAQADLPPAPV